MIERCPLCSERPASGSELKVSSEVTADKIWLLDVAPGPSAFSPVHSASSTDGSSLQPYQQQLPRMLSTKGLSARFISSRKHSTSALMVVMMIKICVTMTLFFPPLSPLNVLKPNILPKFASAFTTCSVTTCWQLQNGRMKVVRYQEPFEPRISIKRSRSHER